MKGKKYVRLIVLALAVAFVVQVSGGDGAEYVGLSDSLASAPLEGALAEDLKDMLDKIAGDDVKMRMEITRRIEYYFYMSGEVDSLMDAYSESLIPMVCQRDLFQGNPGRSKPAILNAPEFSVILNFFIQILQPFYAIAILFTGVYLLFISGSPAGRARAKSTLIKLIVGLGLITLTVSVVGMLLELSHYMTSLVLITPAAEGIDAPVDTGMFLEAKESLMKNFLAMTFFDELMGLPFLAATVIPPAAVLATLAMRYFMVILLTAFFPFTVLFYSFMTTKRIGEALLKQMMIWIFMPVVYALWLVVTWIAYDSAPSIPGLSTEMASWVGISIVLSGYLVLFLSPLLMTLAVGWMEALGLVSAVFLKPVALTESYFEKDEQAEEAKDSRQDKAVKATQR